MGLLVIIPLAAASAWVIARIFLWIRRGDFGQQWIKAFGGLATIGVALGIWLALFSEYTVAKKVHLRGFPIPSAMWNREKPEDAWVTAPIPLVIQIAAQATDVLFGVAACLVPLAVAAFFRENRGKGIFTGPPNQSPS